MVIPSIKSLFSQFAGRQRCPDCDESLTSEAINIKEGVALCPECGKLSRLSDLSFSTRSIDEILAKPPSGCSITPSGKGVIVRASLRSIAGFLTSGAFALFWNALVSVFVLFALAGLITNLVGPLPVWFPAPGLKGGKPVMNGQPMDLGSTLFLCVFLIPFVIVGVLMAVFAIMNLFGKIEVALDEFESSVATGVGFFVWKRKFDCNRVHSIRETATPWQNTEGTHQCIELISERTIKFGSLLSRDRKEWMRVVLKVLLLQPGEGQFGAALPKLIWIARRAN